jgi:hypothetical protein
VHKLWLWNDPAQNGFKKSLLRKNFRRGPDYIIQFDGSGSRQKKTLWLAAGSLLQVRKVDRINAHIVFDVRPDSDSILSNAPLFRNFVSHSVNDRNDRKFRPSTGFIPRKSLVLVYKGVKKFISSVLSHQIMFIYHNQWFFSDRQSLPLQFIFQRFSLF